MQCSGRKSHLLYFNLYQGLARLRASSFQLRFNFLVGGGVIGGWCFQPNSSRKEEVSNFSCTRYYCTNIRSTPKHDQSAPLIRNLLEIINHGLGVPSKIGWLFDVRTQRLSLPGYSLPNHFTTQGMGGVPTATYFRVPTNCNVISYTRQRQTY